MSKFQIMSLNRLSGIGAVIAGLFLVFHVIPNHTEPVDYGWLGPETLPRAAAVIVIIAGAVHALFPRGGVDLDLRSALKACLYLGICSAGLYLMHRTGFAAAAPVLMLVLMLTVGERRWTWLVTGVLILPAGIWLFVEFLLGRPLP